MIGLSIELLTPARVVEEWSTLEPLMKAACEGNPIARDEMTVEGVLGDVLSDRCAVFAGKLDGTIVIAMALQFFEVNGRKGVDVMAMAGAGALKFKRAYWRAITEWLRANGVEFIDAYVPNERAAMYMKKFGFDKSCAYMRMSLGDTA